MDDESARHKLDILETRFASIKGNNAELNQTTTGLRSENVRLSSRVKLLEKELGMMRNVVRTSSDITGVSTIRDAISEPASPPTPPSRKNDKQTPQSDVSSSQLSVKPRRKAPGPPSQSGTPNTTTATVTFSDIEVSPVPSRRPPHPPTSYRQPNLNSDLNKTPPRQESGNNNNDANDDDSDKVRFIENRILPSPGREFSTISNIDSTNSAEGEVSNSALEKDFSISKFDTTGDTVGGGTKLDFSRADPHPTQKETLPGGVLREISQLTTLIESVSQSTAAADSAVMQELESTKNEVLRLSNDMQQLGVSETNRQLTKLTETVAVLCGRPDELQATKQELAKLSKTFEKYVDNPQQMQPIVDQLTATKKEVILLSSRIDGLITPSQSPGEVVETKNEIIRLNSRIEDFLQTYPTQSLVDELAETKTQLFKLSAEVSKLSTPGPSGELLETRNEVIRLSTRIEQFLSSPLKQGPSSWDLLEARNEVSKLASKIENFVDNPQPIVSQLVETKEEVGKLAVKIDQITRPNNGDIPSSGSIPKLEEELAVTKQEVAKLSTIVKQLSPGNSPLTDVQQVSDSKSSRQLPLPKENDSNPPASREVGAAKNSLEHLSKLFEELAATADASETAKPEMKSPAILKLASPAAPQTATAVRDVILERHIEALTSQNALQKKEVEQLRRINEAAIRLELENTELKEQLDRSQQPEQQGNESVPNKQSISTSDHQSEAPPQSSQQLELENVNQSETIPNNETSHQSNVIERLQREITNLKKVNESIIRLELENSNLKERLQGRDSTNGNQPEDEINKLKSRISDLHNEMTTTQTERESTLSDEVLSQREAIKELRHLLSQPSDKERLLIQERDAMTMKDSAQRQEINNLRKINESVIRLEFENSDLKEQLTQEVEYKQSEREQQLTSEVDSQKESITELQEAFDQLVERETQLTNKLDSVATYDAAQRKEISDLRERLENQTKPDSQSEEKLRMVVEDLENENDELRDQLCQPSDEEVATLRRMLKSNTESASRLNAENASLMETIEQQDSEMKKLLKKKPSLTQDYQNEISKLRQLLNTNTEASEIDQENLSLMNEVNKAQMIRIETLEGRIEELESVQDDEADNGISVINRFIDRAVTVERLLETKKEHAAHLTSVISNLTKDNDSLRSQISHLSLQSDNETEGLEQSREEHVLAALTESDGIDKSKQEIVVSEFEKLKLKYDLQQDFIANLEERITDAATSDMANLQNDISRLENEVLCCKVREWELQEQIRDIKPQAESGIRELVSIINQQNTEIDNLKTSVNDAKPDSDNLQEPQEAIIETLKEQLQQQTEAKQDILDQNKSLKEDVQKLLDSKESLKHEVISLEESLQAAKKTIPQSNKEISCVIEGENDNQQEKQLLREIALRETIQEHKKTIASLKSEIQLPNSLNDTIEVQKNEIISLNETTKQLQQEVATLTESRDVLKQKVNKQNDNDEHHLLEVVALKETIQKLQSELTSLTESNETLRGEVNKLSLDLSATPQQSEQQLLEMVSLKETIQEQKKLIVSLSSKQNESQAVSPRDDTPEPDIVDDSKENELQIVSLKETVEKLQTEINNLQDSNKRSVEELTNENNELKQSVSKATDELSSLRDEQQKQESDSSLKELLEKQTRECETSEKRCETLQAALRKHSKQVNSLEQELREHRERELELQETIVSLQTEGVEKSPTKDISVFPLKFQISSLEKKLSESQRSVAILREQISTENGKTSTSNLERDLTESLEREQELKRTIDLLGSSNEVRQAAQKIATLEQKNEKLKTDITQGVEREKDLISAVEVLQHRERELTQPLRKVKEGSREPELEYGSPAGTGSPWGDLSNESTRKGSNSPPSQHQYLLIVISDLEIKLTASLERESRLQDIAASGESEAVKELESKLSNALQRESHLQQSVAALSSSDAVAVAEKRIQTPPSTKPEDDLTRLQNTIEDLKHQQLQSQQRLKFETNRSTSLQKQLRNEEDHRSKISSLEHQITKQNITCEQQQKTLDGLESELSQTRNREEDLLSELSQLHSGIQNGSSQSPVIRTPGIELATEEASRLIGELENEVKILRGKNSDLKQRDSEQRDSDLDEMMRLKVSLREKEGEVEKLQQKISEAPQQEQPSDQGVLVRLRDELVDSDFDHETITEIHDLTNNLLKICAPQDLAQSPRISPARSRMGNETKLREELAAVKQQMQYLMKATKSSMPLEMENKILRERIKEIQQGEGENETNAMLLLATYKKEVEILRQREGKQQPEGQQMIKAAKKAADRDSTNIIVLQNKQLKTKVSELASKLELLSASEARWKASCEQLHTELCVAAKVKSSLVHDLNITRDISPYQTGFSLSPQPIRNEDALNLLVTKKGK